jgi:hypothetical protein
MYATYTSRIIHRERYFRLCSRIDNRRVLSLAYSTCSDGEGELILPPSFNSESWVSLIAVKTQVGNLGDSKAPQQVVRKLAVIMLILNLLTRLRIVPSIE